MRQKDPFAGLAHRREMDQLIGDVWGQRRGGLGAHPLAPRVDVYTAGPRKAIVGRSCPH